MFSKERQIESEEEKDKLITGEETKNMYVQPNEYYDCTFLLSHLQGKQTSRITRNYFPLGKC